MIEVKSQYAVNIKFPGLNYELPEPDLHTLKVIEEAGNLLPVFELIFTIRDLSVVYKLVEGCTVSIGIGKTPDKIIYSNFTIVSKTKQQETESSVFMRIAGVLAKVPYALSTKLSKFIDKKSMDVLKATAGAHFSFSTNIQSTPVDDMNWFQTNITDRAMANKAWIHSKFSDNEIMMTGITAKEEFRARGVKATLAGIGVNKWKFTHDPNSKTLPEFTKVVYTSAPRFISSTGTVDFLAGYPKSRIIHNVDNKQSSYDTPNNRITIANTEVIETMNIGDRINTVSIQNSNVHPQFLNARDYNICNLNRLNSFKAKLTTINDFYDIGLLDLAVIDVGDPKDGYVTEEANGFWFVNKVCRAIVNRKFITIVTLCRDSINRVGG